MSTAAAGPNPLLSLLDLCGSAMLLFSADAHVVFANRAARQLPSRPVLVLPSDPQVRQLVRGIAQGQTVPQLRLALQVHSDQGVAELDCEAAPRPIAGLVALVVTPRATGPAGTDAPPASAPVVEERLSLPAIMNLLSSELVPPMNAVLASAGEVAADPRALANSVRHLSERLMRLVDLVDVFGDDALIGEERVLVPELVTQACTQLLPLTKQLGVSVLIEGVREDLPPVYGSRRLLQRAVVECLHNAVEHARDGVARDQPAAVRLDVAPSGNHLLLTLRNHGALSASVISRHAATLFRHLPGMPPAPERMGPRIGLPLAQRILQLHGGHLRVDSDDGEVVARLELPTGAPMRNTHHLDLLQAQIYAEDLSRLMARSRNRRSTT